MNVLEEAKKRPKLMTAGITAMGVIGFFIAWDKLSPTLEFTVKLRNAPAVADAAYEKATQADEKADAARAFIDAWIEDQQQQRAFEKQMSEREAEYQKKMLEIQQQQLLILLRIAAPLRNIG